jgi:GMP synthase-like glutamine amidotransferase
VRFDLIRSRHQPGANNLGDSGRMRAHCFQHVPFEGLGSIATWLAESGAQLTTTRFFEAPVLPAPGDVDLLIVMGGPMSANDDRRHPWLVPERAFIRDAIDRGTTVLGVCLGSQLIARAMGARVYANREREIGWFPITGVERSATGPAWATAGHKALVFHWHGDTFDLPPGATHLARSAGCEHQGFQIGDRVIGLQFHLETTPASLNEMVTHGRSDLIPSRFVQTEAAILSVGESAFADVNAMMSETLDVLTKATGSP